MNTNKLDYWIAVPVEVADDEKVAMTEQRLIGLVEALNEDDGTNRLSLMDKLRNAKQDLRKAVVDAKRIIGEPEDSARVVEHWGIVTEDDSRGHRNYKVVVVNDTAQGGRYFFGKGADQDQRSDQIDRMTDGLK